jgi:hypothetical protein
MNQNNDCRDAVYDAYLRVHGKVIVTRELEWEQDGEFPILRIPENEAAILAVVVDTPMRQVLHMGDENVHGGEWHIPTYYVESDDPRVPSGVRPWVRGPEVVVGKGEIISSNFRLLSDMTRIRVRFDDDGYLHLRVLRLDESPEEGADVYELFPDDEVVLAP